MDICSVNTIVLWEHISRQKKKVRVPSENPGSVRPPWTPHTSLLGAGFPATPHNGDEKIKKRIPTVVESPDQDTMLSIAVLIFVSLGLIYPACLADNGNNYNHMVRYRICSTISSEITRCQSLATSRPHQEFFLIA